MQQLEKVVVYVETTGIIDLLPIADVAIVGGKWDPYVRCYQTKKLKDDKECNTFGTQTIESNLNPVWTREFEEKKLLDEHEVTKNKKDIKRINLTVNENVPIELEYNRCLLDYNIQKELLYIWYLD